MWDFSILPPLCIYFQNISLFLLLDFSLRFIETIAFVYRDLISVFLPSFSMFKSENNLQSRQAIHSHSFTYDHSLLDNLGSRPLSNR